MARGLQGIYSARTCTGLTTRGRSCHKPAIIDSDFCVFHDPALAHLTLPERRAEARERYEDYQRDMRPRDDSAQHLAAEES